MKYSGKLFLLILSLLGLIAYSDGIYANVKSIKDTIKIEWNEPTTIKFNDSSFLSRLNFNGANYLGKKQNIPYFVKTYNLKSDEVKIIISNKKFEELSINESLLIDVAKLKSDIDLSYSIGVASNQNILNLEILPFRINATSNKIEKLLEFSVKIIEKNQAVKEKTAKKYKSNSALSSGKWHKIKISEDGIYKVSGSDLSNMGFSISNLNIDHIHLYGNGGGMNPEAAGKNKYDDLSSNAIKIFDLNNDGIFDANDYFIFYGKSPNTWKYSASVDRFEHTKHIYDDFAYYFIGVNSSLQPIRILQQTGNLSPNQTISHFRDFQFFNADSLNLIKSGRTWYARKFDYTNSYSFSYVFPNTNKSKSVKLTSRLAARSTTNSSAISVTLNNIPKSVGFSPVSADYTAPHAQAKKTTFDFQVNTDNINIVFSYNKPNNNALAYIDYFEVEVERALKLTKNQQNFRSPESVGNGNISKFIIENSNSSVKIWDITNHNYPIEANINTNNSVSEIIFQTDTLKEFIAFKPEYKSVTSAGAVENQNLHALEKIDYIIIYHPEFIDEANYIADFHRNVSNLRVETITQEKIFNEFSSGAKDPAAIRDFMKMLYDKEKDNPKDQPKYLLFFGDGSYDNKSRITNNTNFIITYQSEESLAPTTSFVSDDYFGLLDDNEGINAAGHLDIGIGRIPVTTKTQAQEYIDKFLRYINERKADNNSALNTIAAMGDWRNNICFIADDQDNNIHIYQADLLATNVVSDYKKYNVDKIYFDAYPQTTVPGGQRYPQVKSDLLQKFNKGALIINYIGHGGEAGLAHESVLEVPDILKMDNSHNLTTFITATCEFSRFDDPGRVSAGEHTFLNSNGGAIALLSTTRLAYSGSNFSLNNALMNVIFEADSMGNYPKLGDLIRLSKVNSGSMPANRNFMLIGDPACQITYPAYDIETIEIDNKPVNGVDTISALTKITIKAQIENNGVKMTDFNGIAYPTVFDKEKEFITRANDNDSYPYQFKLQKNIIYKGKAEVVNGEFEFTFIVPKDISYNYDFGKISYYATDGQRDASGYYDSIIVGGTNNNPKPDTIGPVISLFLNDTNFVAGGLTNESPLMLAFVFDENGINTTGNGIGHDIVATLDENTSEAIVLNDFYEADLNSFQSGTIRYPFSDLSEGEHSLTLKVWDIYNNSAMAKTYFIVASSEDFVINNLMNYPNPFSESTTFSFEHNQVAENMLIEINVFNLNGQLQKTIRGNYTPTGFKAGKNEIVWNGTNNNGHKLESGIYIYQLKVKIEDKNWVVKSNKLVIYN